MDCKYYNSAYILKQKAKRYVSFNKYLLIFLAFIFLIAMVTGIFVGIKGSDNISISNINDKTLVKFFKGDMGPFAFFITRITKYFFVLTIIFLLGKTKFCFPIISIFLAFMSYSLGLNSSVFIILFGIGGTINAIIVIIPIRVVVLAVYIIASCLAIKSSSYIKKYGTCYSHPKAYLRWGWFLAVLAVVTILETILINMFSSAFIFDF